MSAFAIYQLNKDQTDLFYFNSDGNLDLELVLEKMTDEYETPSVDSKVIGEGFLNAHIGDFNVLIDEKFSTENKLKFNGGRQTSFKAISATVTGAGSLGYYSEVYIENGSVRSQRQQHTFYSKADILLTEGGILIAYFESVVAEKIKTQLKGLFEGLGFDISTFKISTDLLKIVREICDWTEVKLERIDNEQDNTKKVSYEIDITNKDHESLIDSIYRDKGKIVQISFHLPYNLKEDHSNLYCVKLFHKEHRGSLLNNEFNTNHGDMKKFIIYVTNFLLCL